MIPHINASLVSFLCLSLVHGDGLSLGASKVQSCWEVDDMLTLATTNSPCYSQSEEPQQEAKGEAASAKFSLERNSE